MVGDDDTYVQFELCAQNIVSGDVVDTLYRCVHNVYVAHQAGMPRQQDAHGISRVRTLKGVMILFLVYSIFQYSISIWKKIEKRFRKFSFNITLYYQSSNCQVDIRPLRNYHRICKIFHSLHSLWDFFLNHFSNLF